ncbi:TolB family protein [Longispora urticae]
MRTRLWIALAATVALVAVALGYTVYAARRVTAGGEALTLDAGATLFRGPDGRVSARTPEGGVTVGERTCDRFSAASGVGLCLVVQPGAVATTTAIVLDGSLRETRRIQLAGIPSRARVSPTGRFLAWTTFTTGDSYAAAGTFSTATGILDGRTGNLVTNIENLQLYVDGQRYHAPDVNFWGVTFSADDNTFYATVATRGRTHLVKGDFAGWRVETVRENVECPSLSPDGRRVAYKKKVGSGWRLHVLDLSTLADTPLAESAEVDDQAVWFGDSTVGYGRAGTVWTVPADGSGAPTRLVEGTSPSPALAAPQTG